MKLFQTILLIILGFGMIIGVLMFAGVIPGFRSTQGGSGGTVVLWGTIPKNNLSEFIVDFNRKYKDQLTLEYVAKSPATFEQEYIEALARGQGPDLILFPHELIFRLGDTLAPIPYESVSERTFRDTYVEGAEIFLRDIGILALPVYVDPMVMYYNRNIFTNSGVVNAPTSWSGFLETEGRITKTDSRGNILLATTALGEFSNVTNAKDILSMLILQAGNPIVEEIRGSGRFGSVLDESRGYSTAPAPAAVDFFVQFADQSKSTYSWNKALPEARNAFTAETLATYFGFASELSEIRKKNPNLNLDIAPVPQRNNTSRPITFGRLTGIGVVKNSRNIQTAYTAAFLLTARENAEVFVPLTGRFPLRRDLLANSPTDLFGPVFYKAAFISDAWVDPSPTETKSIFENLTSSVLTRREQTLDAVKEASAQISNILKSN